MSPLSRREFITRVPLAAAGAMALGHAGYSYSQAADVIVESAHGKLRGLRENGVIIFKGIPYAGRVSGDRRFLAPAPLAPWPGIRDALRLGHPSIQSPHSTYGLNEPEPDEECLVLNVWTPANDNNKRPVMFYNHGGGYTGGSSGSVAQDGANLARRFNVVVVQTNHRLGLLGYLYLDEVAGEEYAGSGNRPERFAAAHNMAEMWTTFARTGVPFAQGQPEWPPYSLPERPTMRIDSQCEVVLDRYGEEREMWEALIGN